MVCITTTDSTLGLRSLPALCVEGLTGTEEGHLVCFLIPCLGNVGSVLPSHQKHHHTSHCPSYESHSNAPAVTVHGPPWWWRWAVSRRPWRLHWPESIRLRVRLVSTEASHSPKGVLMILLLVSLLHELVSLMVCIHQAALHISLREKKIRNNTGKAAVQKVICNG